MALGLTFIQLPATAHATPKPNIQASLHQGQCLRDDLSRGDSRWTAQRWRKPEFRVTPQKNSPSPQALLADARTYLGAPYAWGATGPEAFDCSGFVGRVFARQGYDLPRTSREIFKVGLKVDKTNVQPGDLLFFSQHPQKKKITHVAIAVDDDTFIHAATGKAEVTYDHLSSRYYKKRFVGVRRLLALPPGRYTNDQGLARPGALVDKVSALGRVPPIDSPYAGKESDRHDGTAVAAQEDDTEVGDAGGDVSAQDRVTFDDLLREHLEKEARHLANPLQAPSLTRLGPKSLDPQETAFGIRTGIASIGPRTSTMLVPGLSYFNDEDGLHATIETTIQIPFNGDKSMWALLQEQWSTLRGAAHILRTLRYGSAEAPLYFDLGRHVSASLGHGRLMRYFTPNLGSDTLPHYAVGNDALSLAAAGRHEAIEGEIFVTDLFSIDNPIGGSLRLRPNALDSSFLPWKTLGFNIDYVVDPKTPYHGPDDGSLKYTELHALSVGAETTLFKNQSAQWQLYADAAALLHLWGGDFGVAGGSLLKIHPASLRGHHLQLRLEVQGAQPRFMHSYFDATYGLFKNRAALATSQDATRLDLLQSMEGLGDRLGVYGELTYRYRKKLNLGFAIEDGNIQDVDTGPLGYSGHNLMVFAEVERMYLGDSDKTLSLHFAYHLRNDSDLVEIFDIDSANEYVYVAASLALSRHWLISGSLRKALGEVATESGPLLENTRFDGSLGVVYRIAL